MPSNRAFWFNCCVLLALAFCNQASGMQDCSCSIDRVCSPESQCCVAGQSVSCLYIYYDSDLFEFVPILHCAQAAAYTYYGGICDCDADGTFDFEGECRVGNENVMAGAGTSVWGCQGDGGGFSHGASAISHTPSDDCWAATSRTMSRHFAAQCAGMGCNFPPGLGYCFAFVDYNFELRAWAPLPVEWTAQVRSTFEWNSDEAAPATLNRHVSVTQIDESLFADFLITARSASLPSPGVEFDSQSGTWGATTTVPCTSSGAEITLRSGEFTDGSYDVNADGRFNALDVGVLASVVPTHESEYQQWDLDGDGTTDSDDLAHIDVLVDLGLDSGVFADWDADGSVDCDQLSTMNSAIGYELGDAGYSVLLDYNLDGVTDGVDRAALLNVACLIRGDMNCDGAVDGFDVDPFLLALSDPQGYASSYPTCDWLRADMNLDGSVNGFDRFWSALLRVARRE